MSLGLQMGTFLDVLVKTLFEIQLELMFTSVLFSRSYLLGSLLYANLIETISVQIS